MRRIANPKMSLLMSFFLVPIAMAVLVKSAGTTVENKSEFSRNETINAYIGNGLEKPHPCPDPSMHPTR
jgi:hypothetical protein